MAPTFVFPLPPHPNNQALTSKTFKVPPIDGTLVGGEIFDWQFKNSPEHHVLEYLDEDGKLAVIKWGEAGAGIHRAARSVRKLMGASLENPLDKDERKTIIALVAGAGMFFYDNYISHSDGNNDFASHNLDFITSFTLTIGIIRAGFVPFPISPRNSPAAVAHLLSKSSTSRVIVGREKVYQDLVNDALKIMKDQGTSQPATSPFPVFDDFYSADAPETEYVAPAFAHPDLEENCLILHSSGRIMYPCINPIALPNFGLGSTAFPKPIYWTHRNWVGLAYVPFFGERDVTGMRMACHALPMYHGMGVIQCCWAVSLSLFRSKCFLNLDFVLVGCWSYFDIFQTFIPCSYTDTRCCFQ